MPHSTSRMIKAAAAALLSIVMSLAVATPAAAQTERGQKSFGLQAGYVSRNTSVFTGLCFEYAFSRHVRLAPQVGVVFRHNNLDAFCIDMDVQFPIAIKQSAWTFYPLVGAAFNSWGRHDIDPESSDDVTTHTTCFGLNAGAGFEVMCTDALKLSLQGRYTLVKHLPGAQVLAGIAFVF